MNINAEEILPKILAKMENNVKAQAVAQGLTEEEVDATWILNRKKITADAEKLEKFFKEALDIAEEQLPL